MNTGLLIAIIVVIVVVAALAVLLGQRRRSQQLQERFGPEYQRAVAREGGDRRSAESQLTERAQHRGEFEVVELAPDARARYQEAWRATQGKFVDDPATATSEADVLVTKVMRDRGYPVDDFDRRVDDISVDHPRVAEDYREAHAVSRANEQGLASTDDLRKAFVHYRSLFVELLGTDGNGRRQEVQS